MPRTQFSQSDLSQLERQLDSWRQSQFGYSRLPEEAWAAAATLATSLGVGCVARALRLDYVKLKDRVKQQPGLPASTALPAAFVELQMEGSPSGAPRWCRIELSDAVGGRMTVQLPCDAAAVLGLAQVFWGRG